MIYDGIGSLMG